MKKQWFYSSILSVIYGSSGGGVPPPVIPDSTWVFNNFNLWSNTGMWFDNENWGFRN